MPGLSLALPTCATHPPAMEGSSRRSTIRSRMPLERVTSTTGTCWPPPFPGAMIQQRTSQGIRRAPARGRALLGRNSFFTPARVRSSSADATGNPARRRSRQSAGPTVSWSGNDGSSSVFRAGWPSLACEMSWESDLGVAGLSRRRSERRFLRTGLWAVRQIGKQPRPQTGQAAAGPDRRGRGGGPARPFGGSPVRNPRCAGGTSRVML